MCTYSKDGPSQDEPLGRLIYHMAQDLGKYAEKVLKPFDLTLEQLQILKVLPCKEGMTQKDIGTAVNKTPANISKILDRLEEKTLLERRRNPGDRRASLVFITTTGKQLCSEVTKIFDSCSNQFLKGITDQEQAVIRSAFRTMNANINVFAESEKDN